jgi:hypothetical protein
MEKQNGSVLLMTEIEVIPQKIVYAKTVILRSRLDYNKARLQGEKYKRSFFDRFGFLKPKADDVQLIYFEKYYEPYIVLSARSLYAYLSIFASVIHATCTHTNGIS